MPPRFLDAGETALVVEFGSTVDEAINERVLALDVALRAARIVGVVELVPTYRSLMVHYDPLVLARVDVIAAIGNLPMLAPFETQRRLWRLPACYDPAFSEDIDHVAAATGLDPARIVDLHAQARYRVYMYGFAPGFAYLGGLPKELALPRRLSPRDHVPAGSLIIAGGQALVMTVAMPSGWHILGRTPERLFSLKREPAFLMAPGDFVTFDPIDRHRFDELEGRAAAGEIVASVENVL
jgi:inhibitor of KinA